MMDDLLRHCMRELAFDGELGCDVCRLRNFIEAFYASQARKQTVDNAFHAFVWSLLVQQPPVRVGIVPQDADVLPGHLQPIDDDNTSSLDALIQHYGNKLRVAVDPETSFRAITGSHSRPAKLTAMVYTALQLISRGREDGLSVIELGKKTGYDQKACFYLIKQLCELDLIVKLSKGGPGGGNFCIHKYFFMTSPFWEGIRREEVIKQKDELLEQGEGSRDVDYIKNVQFEPMDTRHLSSTKVIKLRLSRLLKNSENGLHAYQNLLPAIGFTNPTKQNKKFFAVRIRDLIKEGFVEKVVVPKMGRSAKTLCIRLAEGKSTSDINGVMVQPMDVGNDEQEAVCDDIEKSQAGRPIANLTIHMQILRLVEEAGHKGITINTLSTRLGNFDKRTVEHLLSRLERCPPPPHLAHLAVCDFLENQGRERRHRYYTLPGYLALIQREKIDHAGRTSEYTSRDFNSSGGFYTLTEDQFHANDESLVTYEDGYRDKTNPSNARGIKKLGRPRKDVNTAKRARNSAPDEHNTIPAPQLRRGNIKTTKAPANAEDDHQPNNVTQTVTQKGTKRKRDAEDGGYDSKVSPNRKGTQISTKTQLEAVDGPLDAQALAPASTKQRGCPAKKSKILYPTHTSSTETTNDITVEQNTHSLGLAEKTGFIDTFHEPRFGPVALGPVMVSDETPTMSIMNKPFADLTPVMTTPKFPKTLSTIATAAPESGGGHLSTPSAPAGTSEVVSYTSSIVPVPTVDSPTSSKRALETTGDGVAESYPPSKRSKLGQSRTHTLVSISQMRAENEFLRVVAACGGIANISSKDFMEAHAQVIAAIVDSGEIPSMPIGTQPDRRTIRRIFEKLEERGRLKILTAIVSPRGGQPRTVKLVYEPEVTQDRLDQYLMTLREDVPSISSHIHKKLDKPFDYTHYDRRTHDISQGKSLHGGTENSRPDVDIPDCDDEAVRSTIRSEGPTVAQLYGFLVGKARRARELHQFTLNHLQGTNHSPYVVSPSDRIIALPYYFNDLPVSTYFAIISATTYNTELSKLMETPEGRQKSVKDLPLNLHHDLKIGRARARNKIFELLEILTSLKLVTPLKPFTGDKPHWNCDSKSNTPVRFDIVSLFDAKRNAISSCYWRFETIAPIYFYSRSDPSASRFHRDVLVRTADEAMPFWAELENICLGKESLDPVASVDSITGSCTCTLEVARGLQRRHSWVSSYILSWTQKQYLYRLTNPSTGYTPLSDPDGGRRCLEHVSDVILAPIDAVYQFFTNSCKLFAKEMERIYEKNRRLEEDRVIERQAAEGRALLAKKAAETRHQLEADWDALVRRVHHTSIPYGSGTRLKNLRTQYLQSHASMDDQKWEASVRGAISGSRPEHNPVLSNIASSIPRKTARRGGIFSVPLVATNQHKSVKVLIERQKERIAVFQAVPQKKKATEGSKTSLEVPRRQRFQWTPEYDDLARDASAIIRARCRTLHRLDWTALDQLFPFLLPNNVRQRLVTLRQEAGGESYLRLLEDKWYKLWLEYRGTEELPDENPAHPSEFDAIAHVEFLRKYIDKRSLRVGLSHVDIDNSTPVTLLETTPEFLKQWRVEERPRPSNRMDVVWTMTGDEHRGTAFLGEAFSLTTGTPTALSPISNGVAESALKMTLSTSDDDYDVNHATMFLNEIGEEPIRRASDELLARGVISESGKGNRKRPGRKLKISPINEDALGGSFHTDFYAEACTTEDMFDDGKNDWRGWSEIATDAEMAAFIELVSMKKVEFQIDVSGPASQRPQLDWNSKKVDDDQITTAFSIRVHPTTPVAPPDSPPESPCLLSIPMHLDDAHGQNCGDPAPCRKMSQGIITCSACLDAEENTFLASLDLKTRTLSSALIHRLHGAEWNGLTREDLAILPQPPCIRTVIDRMTTGSNPLCYWVGYTRPVLVSRRYIKQWAVSIPGLPNPQLLFPRRWLNIKGEKMETTWNAGLRAVVGVLVIRPGIPLAELRERLISVYDRQELNDLLDHLSMEALIAKRAPAELQFKDIRAMDAIEEQETCWTLTWNSWYRVNMYY